MADNECGCELNGSFGDVTICELPNPPGSGCSFDDPALYTITVGDSYKATAPTLELCRAMLKAVGIDITIHGVPGGE